MKKIVKVEVIASAFLYIILVKKYNFTNIIMFFIIKY